MVAAQFCLSLSASAAPGVIFPHRLHLAEGIECAVCHAAAVKSTDVGDNLIPAKEVCAQCHDDGREPSWTRRVATPAPLTHFNHALHLRMGEIIAPLIAGAIDHHNYLQPAGNIRGRLNTKNPCQACHRGLEESDQVSAADLPQMADCLVCHTKIEAPFSCEDCHAKDAQIRPPTHTTHFVNDHSSGKMHLDKTTCTVCHGRTFTCAGCH